MSVELQEAEGRVKAAREAEAAAIEQADRDIAAANLSALNAKKVRAQAEIDYEATFARHQAALDAQRDRVFPRAATPTLIPVAESVAAE